MTTRRYFIDRDERGIHQFIRVNQTETELWADIWFRGEWEPNETAHTVLMDQSEVEEISEGEALAIADQLRCEAARRG